MRTSGSGKREDVKLAWVTRWQCEVRMGKAESGGVHLMRLDP